MKNFTLGSHQTSWAGTRLSSGVSAAVMSSALSSMTPPGCRVCARQKVGRPSVVLSHFSFRKQHIKWPCKQYLLPNILAESCFIWHIAHSSCTNKFQFALQVQNNQNTNVDKSPQTFELNQEVAPLIHFDALSTYISQVPLLSRQ